MTPDSDIARALRHVGSYGHHAASAAYQFSILLNADLRRDSRILEIGMGCGNLARLLLPYLADGRYVGVEPVQWLVDAGREHFGLPPFVHLTTRDFGADEHGPFDFIYSHSVLSHVSRRQLREYFAAVKRQLAPNGIALASLRFNISVDGDVHLGTDSDLGENDYPTISFFQRDTVWRVADETGLTVRDRPEIRTGFMAATNGEHVHDWIELRHATGREVAA